MPKEEYPYWTYETAKWVIFDLDGTLADINHRLHHIDKNLSKPDWHSFNAACSKDNPKFEIVQLLRMFKYYGKQIAIFSGRDGTYKEQTKKWLGNANIEYDLLVMRKPKDYRSDTIIKKEMFTEYMKIEDVWMVIDDRDKVVEMWRELGLTCLQVQKGDF